MLNKSRSIVADELIFTATHKFFDNMSKEEIMRWANTCMYFVYNDLGYRKEQIQKDIPFLKRNILKIIFIYQN